MIAVQPLDQTPMVSLSTRRQFPRQLFADLPRSECLNLLELLHLAAHAERVEHLRHLLIRFQHGFAFTCAMGGLIRLGPNRDFDGFHYVVNAGYPDEWVTLYCDHRLAERDPILKTTLRAPGTYHWRAISHSLSSEQDWSFIAAARGFGLHDGITIGSADQADGLIAFCAFATDRGFDATPVLPLAQYLGHFMLRALRRMAPPVTPPGHRSTQNLSPRELTVLIWMTRGKTNLEIGRILGVRERTIRFHVERIFTKLEVTSRSQAVAVALEEGLSDLGCNAAVP